MPSPRSDCSRSLAVGGAKCSNLRWRNIGDDALNLDDSKSGPRAVLLGQAARAAIGALPRPHDPDAFLFPRFADIKDPFRFVTCWHAGRERAALGKLRLHDLRNTVASQAVMSGENLSLVGKPATVGIGPQRATLTFPTLI